MASSPARGGPKRPEPRNIRPSRRPGEVGGREEEEEEEEEEEVDDEIEYEEEEEEEEEEKEMQARTQPRIPPSQSSTSLSKTAPQPRATQQQLESRVEEEPTGEIAEEDLMREIHKLILHSSPTAVATAVKSNVDSMLNGLIEREVAEVAGGGGRQQQRREEEDEEQSFYGTDYEEEEEEEMERGEQQRQHQQPDEIEVDWRKKWEAQLYEMEKSGKNEMDDNSPPRRQKGRKKIKKPRP